MKQYCFALDLQDDPEMIKEYIEHHKNVWPEVLESISTSGVTEMKIFHAGNRLFMIMETSNDFDSDAKLKADQDSTRVQEWEMLMDVYQKRLPFAKSGQKWVPLENIFSLSDSLESSIT